jgi:AAA domain
MIGEVYDLQTDIFSFKSITDMLTMSKEEFLIKRLVPRQGFGVLYGASLSLKSFVALDMSFAVVLGQRWAGRATKQGAVIYVAAEGASGIAKRVGGIMQARKGTPKTVPFMLLAASPDLGNPKSGDTDKLIRSIHAVGAKPALIVLDTLSQMLQGGDENSQGMQSFVRNSQKLSSELECFVLAVHHIGHHAEKRLRGHSCLPAAADLIIRAERLPDAPASTLSVEKSKDGQSDICLTATMRRVVLGLDDEGEETSTLVVDRIETGLIPRQERKAKMPKAARLFQRAYHETAKGHGADHDDFMELHRSRVYILNSGQSESANRHAYSRGRDWLIENNKLIVTETGMTLAA